MTRTDPHQPTADDLDRQLTARITRLSRLMRHGFDRALEPFGITSVQFGLLNRLSIQDGQVQADLGRRMAIEPATLTGIVQRLEREGWVQRSCDPENRRLQRVWLTDKAREAMPALLNMQAQRRERSFSGFDAEELTRLEELLDRIEANLR